MLTRKIDGAGASQRVPVDRDVSRRDVTLRHQILPCSLRVLVQQLFPWRSACAVSISAVVENEDVQPDAAKAQHVMDIGGYVGSVAMQVKQRSGLRILRWNPPTRKLISFERKRDVVEFHTQVARRDIHDLTGMEDNLRLSVPDGPHDEEGHARDRGEQSADQTKRQRSRGFGSHLHGLSSLQESCRLRVSGLLHDRDDGDPRYLRQREHLAGPLPDKSLDFCAELLV